LKRKSTTLFFLWFFSLASHGTDNWSDKDLPAVQTTYLQDKQHVHIRTSEWNEATKKTINNVDRDAKIWLYIYANNLVVDKLLLNQILKINLARLWIEGNFSISEDALDVLVEDPKWLLGISSEHAGKNRFIVEPYHKHGHYKYCAQNADLINPDLFLDKISQLPNSISITITDAVPSTKILKLATKRGFTTISLPAKNLGRMWDGLKNFGHITTSKTTTFSFFRHQDPKSDPSISIDNKSLIYLPDGPLKFDSVSFPKELTVESAKKLAEWHINELTAGTLDLAITSKDMPLVKHLELFSWNEHVKRVLSDMPSLEEITICRRGSKFLSEEDFSDFVDFARAKKLRTAFFSGKMADHTHRHINVGAIRKSLSDKIIRGSLHNLVLVDADINDEAYDTLKKLKFISTVDLSQSGLTYDNVPQILSAINPRIVVLPISFVKHQASLKEQFRNIEFRCLGETVDKLDQVTAYLLLSFLVKDALIHEEQE
jgi:hypothetical protein